MTTDELIEDWKQKAREEGAALASELEGLFKGEFRVLANCGAPGGYEIRKYGKPVVYIIGAIDRDWYYLDIWANETGPEMLYNKRDHLTKEKLINILKMHLQQKSQLTLF